MARGLSRVSSSNAIWGCDFYLCDVECFTMEMPIRFLLLRTRLYVNPVLTNCPKSIGNSTTEIYNDFNVHN